MFGFQFLAISALAISVSFGAGLTGGYIKGRSDANAARELANERAAVAAGIKAIQDIADASDLAAKQAEETTTANVQNSAVGKTIEDVIAKAPLIPDAAPADFTRRLRQFK